MSNIEFKLCDRVRRTLKCTHDAGAVGRLVEPGMLGTVERVAPEGLAVAVRWDKGPIIVYPTDKGFLEKIVPGALAKVTAPDAFNPYTALDVLYTSIHAPDSDEKKRVLLQLHTQLKQFVEAVHAKA